MLYGIGTKNELEHVWYLKMAKSMQKGAKEGRNRKIIETETKPKTYFSSLRSGRRNEAGEAVEGVEERFVGSDSEALEVVVGFSDLEARSLTRSEVLPALGSTRPPPRPEDSFFEEDMAL